MVALVTEANSVALLLFHVEHSPGLEWFWRWRISGSQPVPYLEWRAGSSTVPRVIQHSEIAGASVEAQWRPAADEPWRQAALHRPACGEAQFLIQAKSSFDAPQGFRAMAEVCGMVSCYCFGPLSVPGGGEVLAQGRPDGPYADNVLLAPGEFVSEDEMVRIANAAPSLGSLIPAPESAPQLVAAAGIASRRFFVRPYRPPGTPANLHSLTHHA